MMGLLEIEEELNKKPIAYRINNKGKLWMEGLCKFYSKTICNFSSVVSVLDDSVEENRNLSGSKLVKKEKVQKAKKEMWGKKV